MIKETKINLDQDMEDLDDLFEAAMQQPNLNSSSTPQSSLDEKSFLSSLETTTSPTASDAKKKSSPKNMDAESVDGFLAWLDGDPDQPAPTPPTTASPQFPQPTPIPTLNPLPQPNPSPPPPNPQTKSIVINDTGKKWVEYFTTPNTINSTMDKYATTITNFTSLLSSTKEEFELLLEQSNFPFRKQIALDSQAVSSSCSTPATADVIAKTLFFHYSHARNPNNFYDPILPSIIYTLHLASTPPPLLPILLSRIISHEFLLLSLSQREQILASTKIYNQFYLLATYHIPLLSHHLDRHNPGWEGAITTHQCESDKHSEHISNSLDELTSSGDRWSSSTTSTTNNTTGVMPYSLVSALFAGTLPPEQLLTLWNSLLLQDLDLDLDLDKKKLLPVAFLLLALFERNAVALLSIREPKQVRAKLSKILKLDSLTDIDIKTLVKGENTSQRAKRAR